MTEKNPFGWEEKIEDGTLPPYQLALLVCGVLAGGFSIITRTPTAKEMAIAIESAGEEVLKQVVDALPERMRMALYEHRVSQMMQALDDRDEAIVQAKGLKALLDDSRALINRMCSILDPTSTTTEGAEQIAARVTRDLAQVKLERDEAIKRAEMAEGEKDEAVARLDQHREATRIAHDHLAAARRSRDAAIKRAEEAERERDEALAKIKEADQSLTVVAKVRDLLEIAPDADTVGAVRKLFEERARALGAIEHTRGILKAHKDESLTTSAAYMVESLRSERDKLAGAEQDLNYARRRIAEMEATIKNDSDIWTSVRKVLSAADDESALDGARRVVRERELAKLELSTAQQRARFAENNVPVTGFITSAKTPWFQLSPGWHPLDAHQILGGTKDETLEAAAQRMIRERDEARTQLKEADHSTTVVARVRDELQDEARRVLSAFSSESLLEAAKRVVKEHDDSNRELKASRSNWIEMRAALMCHGSESELEAAYRWIRERDEARRVLTSFCSESLLEAANRVVGDRDALRNDYSKLKTDLHLILGKSPSETLLDAARRVVLERNKAHDALRTARAFLLTSEPKGTER